MTALLLVFPSHAAQAENAVSDREVLIGQLAAISGPSAQLGLRLQVGMQAYINAINSQGEVNRRSIKLVTRDDGYAPEKSSGNGQGTDS